MKGCEIARYTYSLSGLNFLLTKNGINVTKDYPAIYQHWKAFGDEFKTRGAQGHQEEPELS